VVRGGGETRRKTAIAFALSFTVALMMLAQPVSAGATMKVSDSTGDVGFGFSSKTSEILTNPWGPGTPWVKAGYFDIASAWLSQKGKVYTFGMELAANLPKEGSKMVGVERAEWALWIDPSPWNVATNPVVSLFRIALVYDESLYAAELRDPSTGTLLASLPFTVNGSTFEVEFSAASIGNLEVHWWCPFVRIWQGLFGSAGYAFLDGIDWGTATGQEYYDLPWPPQ
jgi:hypothetical protein